ncbi:hypothetical protein Plec18167_003480 [Paecilomyces lecythidis]|uniref:Uncharacterized protein n=1 Tax=Paecilomyces lecythidis TaxID=3004212 RepID=A0ABR3XY85_9EURO
MERFEVLFDVTKPAHRVRHTQGIDALMRQRGPPDLKNEFDIQLAIENHASLISKWVVEGGDNFYLHPQWKHAMDQAVVHADVPVQRKQVYSVGRYYAYWPSLVHELQGIYSDGTFLPNAERVLALWDRVTFLNAEVLAAGELNISSARFLDQIMEKTDTDTESPLGTQFDFANIDTLQLLVTYVMLLIILNRILYHLSVLSGRPTLSLQENHKDLCRQIWMCIPFMRAMQGMGSILFAAPLYLSYEGATTDSEKKYLLDYIMETAKRSGRYPEDRREVEKFVLNTARSMTGQRPFDTTRFSKSI